MGWFSWTENVRAFLDPTYVQAEYRTTVFKDNAKDLGGGASAPERKTKEELAQDSKSANDRNVSMIKTMNKVEDVGVGVVKVAAATATTVVGGGGTGALAVDAAMGAASDSLGARLEVDASGNIVTTRPELNNAAGKLGNAAASMASGDVNKAADTLASMSLSDVASSAMDVIPGGGGAGAAAKGAAKEAGKTVAKQVAKEAAQ